MEYSHVGNRRVTADEEIAALADVKVIHTSPYGSPDASYAGSDSDTDSDLPSISKLLRRPANKTTAKHYNAAHNQNMPSSALGDDEDLNDAASECSVSRNVLLPTSIDDVLTDGLLDFDKLKARHRGDILCPTGCGMKFQKYEQLGQHLGIFTSPCYPRRNIDDPIAVLGKYNTCPKFVLPKSCVFHNGHQQCKTNFAELRDVTPPTQDTRVGRLAVWTDIYLHTLLGLPGYKCICGLVFPSPGYAAGHMPSCKGGPLSRVEGLIYVLPVGTMRFRQNCPPIKIYEADDLPATSTRVENVKTRDLPSDLNQNSPKRAYDRLDNDLLKGRYAGPKTLLLSRVRYTGPVAAYVDRQSGKAPARYLEEHALLNIARHHHLHHCQAPVLRIPLLAVQSRYAMIHPRLQELYPIYGANLGTHAGISNVQHSEIRSGMMATAAILDFFEGRRSDEKILITTADSYSTDPTHTAILCASEDFRLHPSIGEDELDIVFADVEDGAGTFRRVMLTEPKPAEFCGVYRGRYYFDFDSRKLAEVYTKRRRNAMMEQFWMYCALKQGWKRYRGGQRISTSASSLRLNVGDETIRFEAPYDPSAGRISYEAIMKEIAANIPAILDRRR